MIKHPLSGYVIAVLIVWIIILCVAWFADKDKFFKIAIFCAGFLFGMLAMYIAVHFYTWH